MQLEYKRFRCLFYFFVFLLCIKDAVDLLLDFRANPIRKRTNERRSTRSKERTKKSTIFQLCKMCDASRLLQFFFSFKFLRVMEKKNSIFFYSLHCDQRRWEGNSRTPNISSWHPLMYVKNQTNLFSVCDWARSKQIFFFQTLVGGWRLLIHFVCLYACRLSFSFVCPLN